MPACITESYNLMAIKDNMFYILPHYTAEMLVESRHGYNVISVERNKFVDPSLCKNHLHLKFDDISDRDIERSDVELRKIGMVYPVMAHIEEAVAFDKECRVNIIHCHAGISRSPAIGYALLRGRGMSACDAMELIMKIAPFALPNKRIVRFADEIYGNDMTMEETAEYWRKLTQLV